jgi:hypothetical protein
MSPVSLDDHCFTTLILCDISKVFDRVWHTGLLLKLNAYGIDDKLFKWFESYNFSLRWKFRFRQRLIKQKRETNTDSITCFFQHLMTDGIQT